MRVKAAIEKRVLREAEHIAATGATVRQTARMLGVSKSTVHKDMETRLPQLPARWRKRWRRYSPETRRSAICAAARPRAISIDGNNG